MIRCSIFVLAVLINYVITGPPPSASPATPFSQPSQPAPTPIASSVPPSFEPLPQEYVERINRGFCKDSIQCQPCYDNCHTTSCRKCCLKCFRNLAFDKCNAECNGEGESTFYGKSSILKKVSLLLWTSYSTILLHTSHNSLRFYPLHTTLDQL